MKYLRDTDPRFRNLGLKVSGFFAGVIVLMLLMAAVLGWRNDLFEPSVNYSSRPGKADAIFPGMNVTLHGIRAGRVTKVDLDEEGKPSVTLRIQRRAAQWLREDAELLLTGLGPLESPYLELQTGSSSQPPLPDESILPFRREATIGELASTLEKQLRPVIAASSEFVGEISRPDGDIRMTVAALRALTDALAKDVPPAMADARQAAQSTRTYLDELTSDEGDLEKLRKNLLSTSELIESRLPKMLEDAEQTLSSLKRATTKVEKSVNTSAPEVEELVKRSNEAALRAETLLTDFRKIWMLKLVMPKSKEGAAATEVKKPPAR
jgi:phospholipid/cholesterol/gamma-HCH transport system substrate-binding protein